MSETQPTESPGQSAPPEDPSADVADTQAPAHLEEKGLDRDSEHALEQANGLDEAQPPG